MRGTYGEVQWNAFHRIHASDISRKGQSKPVARMYNHQVRELENSISCLHKCRTVELERLCIVGSQIARDQTDLHTVSEITHWVATPVTQVYERLCL